MTYADFTTHALLVALFFGLAGSFFISIFFLRRRRSYAVARANEAEQEKVELIRSAFPQNSSE